MANRVYPYLKTAAPTVNDDTGDGYLVGDTWLDTTNDLIYQVIDVTAGAAIWLPLVGEYTLEAFLGVGVAPADASTYYIGSFPGQGLAAVDANQRVYIPRSGIVVRADIFATCAAGASNEDSTFSFRLNSTSDTTISSTVKFNSPPVAVANSSLSVAVAAGDYFNIKWATPTWTTNPTNVNLNVKVHIRIR